MFAQKSLKENEHQSLKHVLNGIEFICGTSFQEFVTNGKNKDLSILDKVFVNPTYYGPFGTTPDIGLCMFALLYSVENLIDDGM